MLQAVSKQKRRGRTLPSTMTCQLTRAKLFFIIGLVLIVSNAGAGLAFAIGGRIPGL